MQNSLFKKYSCIGLALTATYAAGFYTPVLLRHCTSRQTTPNAGIFTPESVLASGVDAATSVNPYTGESAEGVRKGTVAATLNNVVLLNKIMLSSQTERNLGKYEQILGNIQSLIKSLSAIGMFHFFTIDEWLAANDQPGRQVVALLYLQNYTSELTTARQAQLQHIQATTKSDLLRDAIKKTL